MTVAGARPRPSTNLRWWIALLLGFGILINYFDRVALSVSQDPLKKDFGIGPAEFGILSSVFFWVYALCQIPIGIVLDRFGVVLVGRIGAFLWGIAALMSALAPNFAFLNVARGALGVAEGPAFPSNAKATSYWFPNNERGLATSIFDSAAKFSNVIAVPALAFIVLRYGWREAFFFTAALSFIYFALFYIFYRNPSEDKRLSPDEYKYIKEGGAQPEGLAPAKNEGARLGYLLSQRKVWGLTIGFSAYGYLFGLLITWLPSYLNTTFHTGLLKSAGYAAIPWFVATLTDLIVGGWLVDYLINRGYDPTRVRKVILIAGMVLGLAIVGAAYTHDINVATFWIAIALGGVAFSAPVGWSIPGLISPKGSVGTIGGIMNCFNNLANAAAPVATGFIVAQTGSFTLALATAGVVLVIGIISYVFVLGKIELIPSPPEG
ncbi:MAG TPA: MFS transporter [Candidatus Baltobacteraceae bacterium]|nr:MFS transporter [Candidatus Baltobacteraceae bacterium]